MQKQCRPLIFPQGITALRSLLPLLGAVLPALLAMLSLSFLIHYIQNTAPALCVSQISYGSPDVVKALWTLTMMPAAGAELSFPWVLGGQGRRWGAWPEPILLRSQMQAELPLNGFKAILKMELEMTNASRNCKGEDPWVLRRSCGAPASEEPLCQPWGCFRWYYCGTTQGRGCLWLSPWGRPEKPGSLWFCGQHSSIHTRVRVQTKG